MARRGENIYHRKDGRWEGRYWIGTGPDGRRIYKSVYGRRYADVRRELAIQRASLYLTQVEPRDSDVPYFLAQELLPGYLQGRECTYRTPAGYFVADDAPAAFAAFDAFDATFPPKEKEVRPGQLWT